MASLNRQHLVLAVMLAAAATACSAGGGPSTPGSPPVVAPGAGTPTQTSSQASSGTLKITDPYSPTIDPAAFSTTIDNAFMPLTPGTRTTYESQTAEGHQQTTTEVTRDTKTIMGVNTVVVHDTVTLDGKPTEDTLDWFAQARDGSVWYFGEATKAFDGGAVDTSGSFEAGVDGALPGIAVPGTPRVGDRYRQEYAKGVAEDVGEVLSLTGSETTPLTGPKTDLLVTKDTDLLDPTGPVENKYYARGIGLVLTVQTTEPPEREQAIAVQKF
jgi:hypothetical protein